MIQLFFSDLLFTEKKFFFKYEIKNEREENLAVRSRRECKHANALTLFINQSFQFIYNNK